MLALYWKMFRTIRQRARQSLVRRRQTRNVLNVDSSPAIREEAAALNNDNDKKVGLCLRRTAGAPSDTAFSYIVQCGADVNLKRAQGSGAVVSVVAGDSTGHEFHALSPRFG